MFSLEDRFPSSSHCIHLVNIFAYNLHTKDFRDGHAKLLLRYSFF